MAYPRFVPRAALLVGLLVHAPLALVAQQPANRPEAAAAGEWTPEKILAAETYVRPPAVIEKLVTAPRQNNVTLSNQSPDRKSFVKLRSEGLPTVKEFGKYHVYFGGLQVDPAANRARSLTTRGNDGLEIIDATTGKSRAIETPKGATVSSPAWSPDGSRIAYVANFDNASRVYVADAATGKSRQAAATPLLATLVTDVDWTADGKSLVAVLIPDGRKPAPQKPAVEGGPLVRMTDGHKDKTRTHASLLRDPYEREAMEYYVTGQLAAIDARTGAVRKIGQPAMIMGVDPSPDGGWFRVTLLQKPFSYIVPWTSFPQSEQLWDATGKMVAELAKRPLRESDGGGFGDDPPAPQGDSASPKRGFGWMPDGSGLYYLSQDVAPNRGGAPGAAPGDSVADVPAPGAGGPAGRGAAAARRDRLFVWTPPFDASSQKQLLESATRLSGVLFSDDAKTVFVAENANGTGHLYAVDLGEPGKRYTIWRMRGLTASVGGGAGGGGGGRGGTGADSATFYQNPGSLMTKRGRHGRPVALVSTDGRYAYLSGTRYNRDWQTAAPRGFADRVEIRTGQKTRVFDGAADVFETVTAVLDDDFTKAVVTRESRTTVPDAWLRDTRTGQVTKLTNNVDYSPEFTRLQRKKIPVTRADGTRFFVDLTLPESYQPGTKLPAMFWFYPYEYTDQSGYDRTLRTQNINSFPSGGTRTIEYMATQGYAVANFNPPIIGAQGRMNDNYVSDLRNNLYAVIDELDRQGYIDRTRLGLGGHSYGAFSTVNAMVHTPFFKAGIAGDGMYNRTLTPNGFQSERRDFWEAQETYLEMSPFLQADKLQGALLMYHGMEDQNVGTDPISSVRMFHALQGLGKTAALYMYPYEDHGPATQETLLDLWGRWTAWLDLYVKNAGKGDPKPVPARANVLQPQ